MTTVPNPELVERARRALRGETAWTPDLAYAPVALAAMTAEISEQRAILDALRTLIDPKLLVWQDWPTKPCDACRRPQIWGMTVAGQAIPLQPVPNPNGTQVARRDPRGTIRVRTLEVGGETGPGEFRFVSHFADCPRSAQFGKARRRTG